MNGWLSEHIGIVKFRQLVDRLRHRLSFVPLLYVLVAVILSQLVVGIDRWLEDDDLPLTLTTTVASARSVFTAIAGGLITSVTLVLSMTFVVVQLASSQFSPRTLRGWLGDRVLQHTIGFVLGTTVFCLLALRSTRDVGERGDAVVPHVAVVLAVLFGVISLVAVVRVVDHLTQRVQIGSIVRRIADDTIEVVRATSHLEAGQDPTVVPATEVARRGRRALDVPPSATPIEASTSGWLQQVDEDELTAALPVGATAYVVVTLGGFVVASAPLAWIDPPLPDDDPCREAVHGAFAVGDTRTMQQDVAYGVTQLTDIAVRALSPGVNDPGTANDVIVHLGAVLLAVWEQPPSPSSRHVDDRTIVRHEPEHGDHLRSALGPILRYGARDPQVVATLLRMLHGLRSEVSRRALPGPLSPLGELVDEVRRVAGADEWTAADRRDVDELLAEWASAPAIA